MYYEKIRDILDKDYNIKDVNYYAHFTDLGLDSLDHVEIIMQIEDEFQIEILDDEGERCKSVKDLVELIQRKKN